MVAIINTGHAIRNIFTYNENKVKTGAATCIGEGNYPMDLDKMSIEMKLGLLVKRAALNPKVTRNSVHVSLNFDPSEKNMDDHKYMEIARAYMQGIGFGEQPYLVYRHEDAAHPHLHIVSVKIRADGSRIDMHNIGKNQSETTRRELETRFGLVPAQGAEKNSEEALRPIAAERVKYGVSQTRQALANVLNTVLPNYNFGSLAELNAVLRLYNVTAETGSEESRLRKFKGVLYQVTDPNGIPIGLPVKASRFFSKPTYAYLERRFEQGKKDRKPKAGRITNVVDTVFLGAARPTLQELVRQLQKEGISLVERRNADGILYGITYVDHLTKSVFNGSVLGKRYSAKGIKERCSDSNVFGQQKNGGVSQNTAHENRQTGIAEGIIIDVSTVLESLTEPLAQGEFVPGALRGKKRKKKRRSRGSSDNP